MSENILNSTTTEVSTTETTVCWCTTMQCCCQKIIKMKKTIDLLKEENVELKSELEKHRLKEIFILIPNRITTVHDTATCCKNKCINKNLKYGSCISNNGYVNVWPNGKIKYFLAEKEENNKWIYLSAQNSFTRIYKRYSLFYYEVKMVKETENEGCVGIGFTNPAKILLCNNNTIWLDSQKFSWKDGDVFGCGIVYQPNKESFAIVFFTKNGEKIGDKIFLEEIDKVRPHFGLISCSIEINFGYDLTLKPFMYDVNKHFC